MIGVAATGLWHDVFGLIFADLGSLSFRTLAVLAILQLSRILPTYLWSVASRFLIVCP